jgi:hypothetical protein
VFADQEIFSNRNWSDKVTETNYCQMKRIRSQRFFEIVFQDHNGCPGTHFGRTRNIFPIDSNGNISEQPQFEELWRQLQCQMMMNEFVTHSGTERTITTKGTSAHPSRTLALALMPGTARKHNES